MSRIMNRQPHEIVGSSDYAEVQAINKFGPMADPHEYNGNPSTGIEIPDYIPRSFKIVNETNDDKYRTLQSEMMDNGWALEQSDDGKKYFTHPTYRGRKYNVYVHTLSNGRSIMLPLVPQHEDSKGLGCSIDLHTNGMFYQVRSNRWVSFWEDRNGKRRLHYNGYLIRREEKKKEYESMLKPSNSRM